MANIYLFDVDGTLTPAKRKADPGFKRHFLKWFRTETWSYALCHEFLSCVYAIDVK